MAHRDPEADGVSRVGEVRRGTTGPSATAIRPQCDDQCAFRDAPDDFLSAPYASLDRRAYARLIDMSLFLLPMLAVTAHYGPPIADGTLAITPASVTCSLLLLGLWGGYEVILISTLGTTIGKAALRIKVVDRRDGYPPTRGAAFVRWLLVWLAYLMTPVGLFILLISARFDRRGNHQGWHDKIVGTVVVLRRPNRPAEGASGRSLE